MEQYINTYSQVAQSITNSMESIQKNIFKDSIITPDQFNILNEINARENCSSSLLAKEISVKKSTITAIINRLTEKELVNRVLGKNDRRITILHLTEKGKGILSEERKKIFDALMPLGIGLSKEDFEKLNENLSLVAEQLKIIKKGMDQDEK